MSAADRFLGAIGAAFCVLGTAPLYALHQILAGPAPVVLDRESILGAASLIVWSLLVVPALEYAVVMLRADNRGEGGGFALHVLVARAAEGRARLAAVVGTLGLFAAALAYGMGGLAPAVTLLAAAEGLAVAVPRYADWVMPTAFGAVAMLFLIQRHARTAMAAASAWVMAAWFLALAVLGARGVMQQPGILAALSPHHAVLFLLHGGWPAVLALGPAVLVVAGSETLYAEMGRFGRGQIRLALYLMVLPALLLAYLGQAGLLLADPSAIANPFFRLAPAPAAPALFGLALAAALTTGHAVLTGLFNRTRQAIQLNYLPRMTMVHTSEREIEAVHLPLVNSAVILAAVVLISAVGRASDLASAFAVGAAAVLLIDTLLLTLVMTLLWGWRGRRSSGLVVVFTASAATFFLANLPHIVFGGWFPLAVGAGAAVIMAVWKDGRTRFVAQLGDAAMPVEDFIASLSDRVARVAGTAVFLTSTREGVPLALLHNLKHNKCIHERVVIGTVVMSDTPFVPPEDRIQSIPLGPGFFRLILRYGFMEGINVPRALAQARTDQLGFFYEPMSISYFVSRETLIPSVPFGLKSWRLYLFAWLARSATGATEFFRLPSNRVVELGSQVEI